MNKHFIASLCLGAALTFQASPLLAQNNRTVTGTVTDDKGEAIIGATVKVNGTKTAVVTDMDGKYSISVPQNAKLTITYIGYLPQTIKATNGAKVVMAEDSQGLDEVVVVGYATQKMKNVTGAIETISTKDIQDLSVGNLGDALVGQFNGLSVNGGSSRPGETPSLQIRQSDVATSVTPDASRGGDANPSPLYVIDGFISTETAFNNLDVNEVENITVLKDAAAAVYGARAAYGVVLVTTKKGQIGAPKISYSGQFGWTDALYTPKMLSSYDYAKVYNTIRAARTQTQDNLEMRTQLFQADEMEAMKSLNYDLLDREWKTAFTQRHNINMSGGGQKANYFASVSYYTQDGNIGKLDYDRWNYRAGVNGKIGKYVDASIQVSGDYGKTDKAVAPSGGGSDYDYESLMTHLPFVPDYVNGYPIVYSGMENTIPTSATQLYNFAAVQNSTNHQETKSNHMTINGSLGFDFSWIKPLKGLSAKVSYSKTINNSKSNTVNTILDVYRLKTRGGSGGHLYTGDDVVYDAETLGLLRLNSDGYLRRSMSQSESYQINLTIQYARQFGKHDVSGLFSIERSEAESENLTGTGTRPVGFHDGQSGSIQGDKDASWGRSESGMLSYIGRLNYAYASKYLFEFLMRSDASTKFAPKNYWGYFPSVSAGWVISEEEWFKKNISWMDFLKVRASWGLMGRDNVKAWLWTQLYNRDAAYGAVFGTSPSNVGYALTMPKAGLNSNVHWDKTYKTNIGIDARFLNSRLSFNMNYYYDRGRELFATRTGTTTFPTTVGTQATPENYGKIDSWGWEFTIGWRDKIGKDITYWAKLNTGYSDNKLLETNFPAIPDKDSIVKGERSDRGVWGYSCLGMFRSYQDIEEYFEKYHITKYMGLSKDQVRPGMLIYKDVNGTNDGKGNFGEPDGVVDQNDYVRLSKRSSNPYGFTLNFGGAYKGFSLSAQLSAAWGADVLIQGDYRKAANNYEYQNMPSSFRDMFNYQDIYDAQGNITVPQNLNASMPIMGGSGYSNVNTAPSSFWIVSGATLSLRNITLGWAVPSKWIKPIGISNIRLNLTVQNAINFLNPYPDGSWAPYGGTYLRYPNLRKVTMGVNVSF